MRWLALLLACTGILAADPVFQDLRPQHPRLMWTRERIAEVKRITAMDPLAKRWQHLLITGADKDIPKPLIEYSLTSKKLLTESRTALDRISTLAGLYQLTGEKRFAERARSELLNVAAFEDWNPANFLATAEMTNAVAIGYDWLFDYLSAEDKTILRKAILEKGLKPGLKVYASGKSWPQVRHNWNAVCNSGLIIGALAIADEEPDTSAAVIAEAHKSLPKGFLDFAPDGGWPEGPGYWGYATSYAAFGLSALQTSLGTDFGFLKSPGFSETGSYRIQMTGNSGELFGFADSTSQSHPAPQLFWLAAAFNHPSYDAYERKLADRKPDIFHLVWFNPQFGGAAPEETTSSVKFSGVDVAVLRAGSTFIGIKGGNNKANHAHLDLGTFVLDSNGERFAAELGPDLYTLPGYFGKERWSYYRTRTEGQNTLLIDGQNQAVTAKAALIAFKDNRTVIDLTEAYAPGSIKVLRGASIDAQGRALIQDEIETREPAEIIWSMHTHARITAEGRAVVLALGKTWLKAEVVSPAGAVFKVTDVNIPLPQRSSPDLRKLSVVLPGKTSKDRIAIRFTPAGKESDTAALVPLAQW